MSDTFDRKSLLAIMAAIIYAGADSNTEPAGYSFEEAIRRAINLLYEVNQRPEDK